LGKCIATLNRQLEKPIGGQDAYNELNRDILDLVEPRSKSPIPRDRALSYARHLEAFIVGDDGVNLLSDGKNRLAETAIISKLQNWLGDTSSSQALWISGPLEPQYVSSTRSASLAVVATALEIHTPFVSHFCEKPNGKLPPGHTNRDKVGLIGLLYSLIYQLLQFKKDDNNLDLSTDRLHQLDGSEESWPKGLALLKDLLHHTKYLPYCVIHALNIFEWSDASDWCSKLLEVLFQHQQEPETTFSLLFTTSGQSRVLSRCAPLKTRYRTTVSMRDMERRGQRLEFFKRPSGGTVE
jgi:hypothetical protein